MAARKALGDGSHSLAGFMDFRSAMRDNSDMKPPNITFALSDSSRGYEVSPDRVPLEVLAGFAKEVADFIKGSDRANFADTEVAVVSGSLALVASGITSNSVYRDFQSLINGSDTSVIDVKRREVIDKWQSRARKVPGLTIRILSANTDAAVQIDKSSDYRDNAAGRLVNVERYIKGEIVNLGGATKPNAHVRLPNGQILTVRTDRNLVSSEPNNLVYQEVQLRIKAKLNLDTNELIDAELVSFEHYAPRMDQESFARLVSNGRKAWQGVEDAADWVKKMRGSH